VTCRVVPETKGVLHEQALSNPDFNTKTFFFLTFPYLLPLQFFFS
jgi:hypothetical protein